MNKQVKVKKANNVKPVVKKVISGAESFAKKVGKVATEYAGKTKDSASKFLKEAEINNKKQKALNEAKKLKPIFNATVLDNCEMVCIGYPDKAHEESEVCKGAIGHYETKTKGLKVLFIYKDYIDRFNLNFYPNNNTGFYYIFPTQNNTFIQLDQYFLTVKDEKVAELHDIAYKIGAKKFTIKYMEETKQLISKEYDFNAKGKVKGVKGTANAKSKQKDKEYALLSIEDEGKFHNSNRIRPNLFYFKDNKKITTLIEAALNNHAESEHFKIEFNSSSSMSKDMAAKIDVTLKKYGASGNASMSSEYEKQTRTLFDFNVEF